MASRYTMNWALKLSSFSVLAFLILGQNVNMSRAVMICLILYSLMKFVHTAYKWHLVNKFYEIDVNGGKLPPEYPSLVPFLGNALSLIWNNSRFIKRSTCYEGRLTSSKIDFLGFEIYTFQDRKTIANIWKQGTLSSPISLYVYVLKYFFGLPERVLSIYRADDSGPFPKPYAGSRVQPGARVDHITHYGFLRALSGPGLVPTSRRYIRALTCRMERRDLSTEWLEGPDLAKFFQDVVGGSLVESLYGPAMLRLNPDFMHNLWGFDASVPWLARGVPSFLRPSAHAPRQRCVDQLKSWYAYAREHFDDSTIDPDGDGDPYWGSGLMRYRQQKLLAVEKHDDDALARMDLGLAWGAVGNTTPCTMLSVFHIFKDAALLERVRHQVRQSFARRSLLDTDPNELTKEPLLSSIYAETLRLYVTTYFVVSSPHADVHLGRWTLPKGGIGLMNAGLSHMHEGFWNSRDGDHPVGSFWADRFLVHPRDPRSGPVAAHVREAVDWVEPSINAAAQTADGSFFSMDGTEGSWFPYGGGHSICPGRFLAKTVILSTIILLVTEYDVEILTDEVKMGDLRFGLGVRGLKHAIPFRIRKRSA